MEKESILSIISTTKLQTTQNQTRKVKKPNNQKLQTQTLSKSSISYMLYLPKRKSILQPENDIKTVQKDVID